MMLAHALASGSQQLWPPPTFATMIDCEGWSRLTMPCACWYAAFTSSERANCGAWPPTVWQLPQRFVPRTFSQKLMRNAWMSAVAGGGPEYVGPDRGGVVTGFWVVAGRPPQPDRG